MALHPTGIPRQLGAALHRSRHRVDEGFRDCGGSGTRHHLRDAIVGQLEFRSQVGVVIY